MNSAYLRRLWRRVGNFVVHHEKVLLALLSVVIVISGTLWYRQFSSQQESTKTVGGTYVDGIVGTADDIQMIASRITRAGLFSLDSNGGLVNELVESWDSNTEKTHYTFVLSDGVEADEIKEELNNNIGLLGPAIVNSTDERTVTIELAQSNPNVPILLSQPLFNYGPYKVSKVTDKTTVFTRNNREGAVVAYINKIIIHAFKTQEELNEALQKHRVDGSKFSESMEVPKGYALQEVTMPRYYAVLFNVNQGPFRDDAFRKAVAANTQNTKGSFVLTYPSEEPYQSYAESVVSSWQNNGLTVELNPQPLSDITTKIAPSRNFQALLTGIDYGAELDPFYLWHSTQVRPPGNNLTGIKDEAIDQLISSIRANINVQKRYDGVEDLHNALEDKGVITLLGQEKIKIIISDNIEYQRPWIPLTVSDRWQAIASWSVK
jgi:ABC-type transport system substrate-binding protein